MTPLEQESIMTLALTAAFADGTRHDAARATRTRIAESLPRQAGGSALTIPTTWALGKPAQQYYAGCRRLPAIELGSLFGSLTEQARSLHGRYAGGIQRKAGTINVSPLLPLVRGH